MALVAAVFALTYRPGRPA